MEGLALTSGVVLAEVLLLAASSSSNAASSSVILGAGTRFLRLTLLETARGGDGRTASGAATFDAIAMCEGASCVGIEAMVSAICS